MKKFYNILSIIFYSELILGIGIFLYAQFSPNIPVIVNEGFGNLLVKGSTVLYIAIFAMLCSVGLTIFLYFIIADRKNISLFNLSVFIFISAFWSLFASKIPAVLFRNYLLFNLIYNFSFALIPIPFILYIVNLIRSGKKVLLTICAFILAGNLFSLIWLLSHNFVFPRMLYVLHTLLIATILFLIFVLIKDFIKRKKEDNKILLIGLGIFSVAALLNLIAYYAFPNKDYNNILIVGLIVFIAILMVVTIKNILNELIIVKNFEKIAAEIPSGIFKAKIDENMTLVYANKFYYNLLGYSDHEATVGFTSACAPFIDSDRLRGECESNMRMGNIDFELEGLAKNSKGEIINVLLNLHHNEETNEIIGNVYNITTRKEYENKLIVAEEEYQIVSRHITHVVCRYDVQTHMLFLPDSFANRYNLPKSCLIIDGINVCSKLVNEVSIPDFLKLFEGIHQGVKTGGAIIKMHELNGNDSWWDITFDTISSIDNIPKLTVIICQDITQLREKELAYIKWTQEIDAIIKQKMYLIEWNLTKDVFDAEKGDGRESILNYDDDIDFNDKMQKYAETSVYAPDRPIFLHKTNRNVLLEQYGKGTSSYSFEYRELVKDGTIRWVSLSIQLIPYPNTRDVKGYFLFSDIDGEKKETLDLKYRANKDALTGLLNRNSFIEKFINAMLESEDTKDNKYLLIIDIDNFKTVNDTHGHFIGDKFLVKIASILISLQKKGDYVGRLGGDEFLMLLKNEKTQADLIDTLNEIIKMLRVEIDGITITCSIGVATFPDDGASFDILYEKADIALYKAKKSGRNTFRLIDSSFLKPNKD